MEHNHIMKTVLIADDDPNMVHILKHILALEGFNVVSENNGKDALETAQRISPDLLILDFTMPIMDGMSVLKELYGPELSFEAPAILLTAHEPNQFRELTESLGKVSFVEKPFEIDSLIDLIRRLLKIG